MENFTIESGHEAYKALENMVFVCSNRFLVKADGSLGVSFACRESCRELATSEVGRHARVCKLGVCLS